MAETSSSRLSAPATMPECSRSRNGKVVEAKRSAAMLPRSRPRQRVAGGLHGHGHGVLVPVAEGALALGLALERRD